MLRVNKQKSCGSKKTYAGGLIEREYTPEQLERRGMLPLVDALAWTLLPLVLILGMLAISGAAKMADGPNPAQTTEYHEMRLAN